MVVPGPMVRWRVISSISQERIMVNDRFFSRVPLVRLMMDKITGDIGNHLLGNESATLLELLMLVMGLILKG